MVSFPHPEATIMVVRSPQGPLRETAAQLWREPDVQADGITIRDTIRLYYPSFTIRCTVMRDTPSTSAAFVAFPPS